jgi:hypothetical protein
MTIYQVTKMTMAAIAWIALANHNSNLVSIICTAYAVLVVAKWIVTSVKLSHNGRQ